MPPHSWPTLGKHSTIGLTKTTHTIIPLKKEYKGKNIEVFVLGYDEANLDFNAELWISAYPHPWEKVELMLVK